MMKLEIFSVYDSKAQAYLPPFFLPSVPVATRVFSNAANDPGHAFGANSGDYTLFHIGDFDDDSAKITTKATPRNIGVAQEFKKPATQVELDLEPRVVDEELVERTRIKNNSEEHPE